MPGGAAPSKIRHPAAASIDDAPRRVHAALDGLRVVQRAKTRQRGACAQRSSSAGAVPLVFRRAHAHAVADIPTAADLATFQAARLRCARWLARREQQQAEHDGPPRHGSEHTALVRAALRGGR
jgi:hypothetical protein